MASAPWTERLLAFARRWFEQPITFDDGNTDIELARAGAALGVTLPGVLRTWYGLVGRRLRPVQDTPVRLHELARFRHSDRDTLPVWIENQGVWRLEVSVEAADDPVVETPADCPAWRGGPLSEVLLAMLVSETLMADTVGSLGRLAPAITTGYIDDPTPDEDALIRSALPPLDMIDNPHFVEPMRGDDRLILRFDQLGWQWMACDAEASERVRALTRR